MKKLLYFLLFLSLSSCSFNSKRELSAFVLDTQERIKNSPLYYNTVDFYITNITYQNDTVIISMEDMEKNGDVQHYLKNKTQTTEMLTGLSKGLSLRIIQFKELFPLVEKTSAVVCYNIKNRYASSNAVSFSLSETNVAEIVKSEVTNEDVIDFETLVLKKNCLVPIDEGYGRTITSIVIDKKKKVLGFNYKIDENQQSIDEIKQNEEERKYSFINNTTEIPWATFTLMKHCAEHGWSQSYNYTGDKSNKHTTIVMSVKDCNDFMNAFGGAPKL